VHVGLLTVGDAPVAKLAIPEVKADPLAGSGAVQVKMKNLAGAAPAGDGRDGAPEGDRGDEGRAGEKLSLSKS